MSEGHWIADQKYGNAQIHETQIEEHELQTPGTVVKVAFLLFINDQQGNAVQR